jgi:hypothetical protein
MNREIEELLRAAAYDGVVQSGAAPLNLPQPGGASAAGRPADAATLAVEVRRLVDVVTTVAPSAVSPRMGSSRSQGSEQSTAETVLRTAAMMTGVGPLVGGLMKLFGSDGPEPLPPLEKFRAPSRLSVEAGLTADREYASIRYGQGGLPAATSENTKTAPTVNVNIQALDSRSFLDRQDDIARAVREAMLHSNSLNDVVLEL